MEGAPTDGSRIALMYERGGERVVVIGWHERELGLTNPRPFWRCDREQVWGRSFLRANPPIAWQPTPEPEA